MDLEVCFIAGSAGIGTSDGFSDLDLINYARSLPDRVQFQAWLAELGAEHLRHLGPGTADGFADEYRLDGIWMARSTSSVHSRR